MDYPDRVTDFDTAEAYLKAHHEDMGKGKDHGANPEGQAFARGLAQAFAAAGFLPKSRASWWGYRFNECPDDEWHGGGQTWCAYCDQVCRYCGRPDRKGHEAECEDPNHLRPGPATV